MRCPNYLFWTLSLACSGEEALGLESGLITDQQITASSSWDAAHGQQNARLNHQAARGKTSAWSAQSNDLNQWLQIDFGRNVKITKLATQGRNDYGDQWVKSYTLAYSAEGSNVFQAYQENESDKVQWFPLCCSLCSEGSKELWNFYVIFYLVLIMRVTFHKTYCHFVSAYLYFKFVSVCVTHPVSHWFSTMCKSIIRFWYSACCHWLKERALWEYRA